MPSAAAEMRLHARGTRYAAAVAAALVVVAIAFPGVAHAGYGVQPSGQTIPVQTDSTGYISSPQTIGMLVYLDSTDSNPSVWVSDTPTISQYGVPEGTGVGVCSPYTPWTEANKYTCDVNTILMKPNTTYYWWLTYYHADPGSIFPTLHISGPFNFTLALASTPPATTPPTTTPPTSQDTPTSSATVDTVTSLPRGTRYDGYTSIRDTTISSLITKTVRLVYPHAAALSASCWNADDFDSVVETSQGRPADDGDTVIEGFWLRSEPSWLYLGSDTCSQIQRLLDSKAASATNGYGLMTALHESMHANGVRNEAQANCYGVQLVSYAASFAGFPASRALYLQKLTLNYTKAHAPAAYWDYARCRDGGVWDLLPRRTNLR